jgi:hypothetical protein
MSALRKEGVEPNLEAIHEAAKIVGVKFGSTKVPEKLVAKLRAHFDKKLKNVPKEEWIICPKCEEITDDDERLLRCPFCGDEGEDEEIEVDSAEDLKDIRNEGSEEDDDEVEPIDGEDYDDSPNPVEPPTVDINDSEDKVENKEKKKITPAKKRNSKAIVTKELESDLEVDSGEEIAPEVLADMKEAFDKEKMIIEREYSNMFDSSYELGCSLRRVYRGQLWKADKIKTWREFCAQMGISHTLAYNLMKIVSEFDKETFLSVGRTKLQLVARAEDVYGLSGDQKNELLNDAKEGASVRKLEGKIKDEQKKNEEKEGKKKGEKKVSTDGKPGRQKKEEQLITLLAKVGGRAKSYSFRDRKSHNELEKWENNSYVEIPISDTVVQYLVLKTDENGEIIGASVAFRKVEPSSKEKAA